MTAKVAVIGVGRMGCRHLQALNALGTTVVAIGDPEDGSRRHGEALAPQARSYSDWEALLQRERVDLLCIATTSPAHAAIVIAAAAAGVPRVLCEKPLATNLASGRRMMEACRRADVRLVVNHSRRLFRPYVLIREAIDRDVFGDLRMMRVTCGAAGLANIGTHAFDLMRWFCGTAITVTGYVDPEPQRNPRGAHFHDPGGHGLVTFAHGRRATFDFTADFSSGFTVEFGCRYGRIVVREQDREIDAVTRQPAARAASLNDYGAGFDRIPLPFDDPVDIVAMTGAMIRHTLSDEPPVCTGEDALAVIEMAAAVHVSDAEDHGAIRLPLADDRGSLERIA